MAAQGLIARVKVAMGVLINSLETEASSRVTRNSPTGVMASFFKTSFDKQDRKIVHKVVTYSRFGVQRVVDLPPLLMTLSKFGVQRVEDLPPLLNTIGVQRVVDLPPLVINCSQIGVQQVECLPPL